METEREMTERAVKEIEAAIKQKLKYIIGFIVVLAVILIWFFLK